LNATTPDVFVYSELDAWNSFDGRDGMRLLVSEQRRGIEKVLEEINDDIGKAEGKGGGKFNFMTVDFRNVLREHCDATSDGIHYNLNPVIGSLFFRALGLLAGGCLEDCEWVQVLDY